MAASPSKLTCGQSPSHFQFSGAQCPFIIVTYAPCGGKNRDLNLIGWRKHGSAQPCGWRFALWDCSPRGGNGGNLGTARLNTCQATANRVPSNCRSCSRPLFRGNRAARLACAQPRLRLQLIAVVQPQRGHRYPDQLVHSRHRHSPKDRPPDDLACCRRRSVPPPSFGRAGHGAGEIMPCDGVHTDAQGPCDGRPGRSGRLQFIRQQPLLRRRNVRASATAWTFWPRLEQVELRRAIRSGHHQPSKSSARGSPP